MNRLEFIPARRIPLTLLKLAIQLRFQMIQQMKQEHSSYFRIMAYLH